MKFWKETGQFTKKVKYLQKSMNFEQKIKIGYMDTRKIALLRFCIQNKVKSSNSGYYK